MAIWRQKQLWPETGMVVGTIRRHEQFLQTKRISFLPSRQLNQLLSPHQTIKSTAFVFGTPPIGDTITFTPPVASRSWAKQQTITLKTYVTRIICLQQTNHVTISSKRKK